MSATNVETVATAVAKKITLAGKYSKFMVFGSWFVDRLAAAGTIDETATAAARAQICLFDQPEKQNEMFDLFFADIKDCTKSMKSLIKEHNKPPKAKKEKVIKEKKPKASKKKPSETLSDPQDELVAEIVAAAQSDICHGDDIKSVIRKGQGAAAPLRPPAAEDAVVEPVKKAPVDAEAKKAAKALEIEAKKAAKALEADNKKTAKAAEDEAKKAAKAAEDEAKKAAKALEADNKKAAKKGAPAVPPTPLPLTAVEAKKLEPENIVQETQGAAATAVENADTKKAAKVADDEAKKTAKALEAEAKKAAKAADDEAKKIAKAADDEAKKAAKALEDEAKKAAKALEADTKKATKAAEVAAKKAAKAQGAAAPLKPPAAEEGRGSGGTNGSPEDDDHDTLNLRPISFPDGRNFLLDESNNYLYDPSCVDLDDFAPVATYRGNQWFPLTPSLA